MNAFFITFTVMNAIALIPLLARLSSGRRTQKVVEAKIGTDVLSLLITIGMMIWGLFVWKSV